MADAFKKVRPGERLSVSAGAYNAFVDAARAQRDRQADIGSLPSFDASQNGIVLVKNVSGAGRRRFDVMGLGAPIILPADNEVEFKSRPVMEAVVPDSTHDGKFVILQEPIPANAIGRAMSVGVTPVYLKGGATGATAGIVEGETLLQAGAEGALILWEEDQPDTDHLGLVRLPSGSSHLAFFTVSVERDDYLDCTDENDQPVRIAKPYLLQKTPFHGKTVAGISYSYGGIGTRTATQGGTSETQWVTPSYSAGEQLAALRCVTGLDSTDWMDLNTGGRCWAAEEET